jgi:hypothetical protein
VLSPPAVPEVAFEKVVLTFIGIMIMSPVFDMIGIPETCASATTTKLAIMATALNRTIILLTIPKSSFY